MPGTNVSWPVPLTRLTPWYPGQFGVPGADSDRGLRQDSNGKILWVDPNHVDANDNRDGTNPDSPLATVAAALTKCRAYSGDVIAVMFNSFWTYGSTAVGRPLPINEAVTITTPGIRIVGVSSGSLGVPWTPSTANTPAITVHAMDVVIEGFNFWNGNSLAGTVGILAEWNGPVIFGENMTVRHCSFYGLAYGVQLDYTWYCHITDCQFDTISVAGIFNPSVYGEPDYTTIENNTFWGGVAAINLPAADYCIIRNNVFQNCDAAILMLGGALNTIHGNTINENPAGANNYIDLTGGSSNLVSDNWLGCSIAQYDATCSDSTSGQWVRNHCVNGETAAAPV
jgi:parallel beta-helix repeat protein